MYYDGHAFRPSYLEALYTASKNGQESCLHQPWQATCWPCYCQTSPEMLQSAQPDPSTPAGGGWQKNDSLLSFQTLPGYLPQCRRNARRRDIWSSNNFQVVRSQQEGGPVSKPLSHTLFSSRVHLQIAFDDRIVNNLKKKKRIVNNFKTAITGSSTSEPGAFCKFTGLLMPMKQVLLVFNCLQISLVHNKVFGITPQIHRPFYHFPKAKCQKFVDNFFISSNYTIFAPFQYGFKALFRPIIIEIPLNPWKFFHQVVVLLNKFEDCWLL